MRIAIVGPTHPYKGGIALHTTELAHRLKAAGHEVELISWKNQYPGLLYPGVQRVPQDKPEIPVFPAASAPLNWHDPLGWYRLGRRLRNHDMVILAYFVPQFQGSAGLAMMQAMGRRRHPKVVAICHNVLQHDPHLGEKQITKLFLSRVDLVVVHSDAEAARAAKFTHKPIRVAAMAAHLPESARQATKHTTTIQRHLLFFGLIRKYKGVDLLLKAVAQVPGIHLTIAGEPRGTLETDINTAIRDLTIADRVTFKPGYAPAEDIPQLFGAADALVLPYRSGTGTQNIAMAFAHGIPVIASRAGTMANQVRDGVDGLLCEAGNLASLINAIQHFYEPGVATKLFANIPTSSADSDWQAYLAALITTDR